MDDGNSGLCSCGCGWAGDEALRRRVQPPARRDQPWSAAPAVTAAPRRVVLRRLGLHLPRLTALR